MSVEPDPSPEVLRARYEGVVHHEASHQFDDETFTAWRSRATRGWGVGALVVASGRVLLVRQDGQWFAPGGMLEPGESPEAGAIREVREETGVGVRIDRLAAITERTITNRETGESFVFYFGMFDATPETTAVADDPGLPEESISSAEWHHPVPADTYARELLVTLLDR